MHTENAREFFNRVLSIFESKLRRLEDRRAHPKTSSDYPVMAASEASLHSGGLGAAPDGPAPQDVLAVERRMLQARNLSRALKPF